MSKRKIDWNMVKAAYVTGSMSYNQLAKDYGIARSAVWEHGAAGHWPELRREYMAEAAQKAIDGAVDDEARRLASIIQAANRMQDIIVNVIADKDQFYRHLVQDEIYNDDIGAALKTTEERIYSKADTRAIKDLTGAIKDMTLVLRNLYNLPTQAERESQRIAAERLNMDKRKAELDEHTDKEITVVLKDAEDYAK